MLETSLKSLTMVGLVASLGLIGCGDSPSEDTGANETETTAEATGDGDGDATGDGDGDPATGDGDGDATGDGDGDATGDGDGDATGDGDGDPTGDGDGDPAGPLALTSPAYERGGVIPDAHTCAGANISPALEWVNPPPGTLSYAVFFTDLTFNFDHSAIWDIPADASGLPEDVDKEPMPADVPGASQAQSYAGWHGYAGPCPPNTHTYQFILYALDVETLDEIDTNVGLAGARAAFESHALASATLDGEFTPP